MKTKIVIFTAWPQLITGSRQEFDVLFEESVDSTLIAKFGYPKIDHNMERYAVWTHDRKLYPDFEYCLFMNKPVRLDLTELISTTDQEHSTYVGQHHQFVLYRRSSTWKTKDVFINTLTIPQSDCPVAGETLFQPVPEQIPERVGIIFIDCWQSINDTSTFKHLPYNFDFYQNMTECLSKYQATNLVFHTGEFGSLPLATRLLPWHREGTAVNIMDIQHFARHYQDRQLYNWIVVGAHWSRCTHEKPLGFYNLLDLKKLDPRLKIFSHMDCVLKFLNDDLDNPEVTTCSDLDYQQDSLTWRITGRVAELIGPV
jgi:hypothetical protein